MLKGLQMPQKYKQLNMAEMLLRKGNGVGETVKKNHMLMLEG